MYKKGLVNIITPSYNNAHLITRLLDSVLIQTYPEVEMFVIDDGSTDNTKEIVDAYVAMFAERGYILHYSYQANAGQSAAINKGLKLVNGEFLTWPDADDWYKTDDAIAKMVHALQDTGEDIRIARCQVEYISEIDEKVVHVTTSHSQDMPFGIMDDAVYQKNDFCYAPISWMVDAKFLDDYIPNRDIYVHKYAGQNVQILFPYLANGKCVTCSDILACYLVRDASHSHNQRDYQLQIEYMQIQLNTYIQVISSLERLSQAKKDEYCQARHAYFMHKMLDLSFKWSKLNEFRRFYRKCKNNGVKVPSKYKRIYLWTILFSMNSYKNLQTIKCHIGKWYRGQK